VLDAHYKHLSVRSLLLVIVVLAHGHDDVILAGTLKGAVALSINREQNMINAAVVF
jgi:hypothetical protein